MMIPRPGRALPGYPHSHFLRCIAQNFALGTNWYGHAASICITSSGRATGTRVGTQPDHLPNLGLVCWPILLS